MLSYCLKCRKNTLSKNPKIGRTKNERTTLFSKCGVCNSKKSKFIEKLSYGLSTLEIKAPITKIPLVRPFLF